MIFKSGCHNKQLTFGRLISICKNINHAVGLSLRHPAVFFFAFRVQTGADWRGLKKHNEYIIMQINWIYNYVIYPIAAPFFLPGTSSILHFSLLDVLFIQVLCTYYRYNPNSKRLPMELNARQVETAKPSEKDYKLPDGNGLILLVKTHGENTGVIEALLLVRKRCWRFCSYNDYRLAANQVLRGAALFFWQSIAI